MNDMFSEIAKYSLSDILRMGYSFVMTKLFFPKAQLVRRPISIRQKKQFNYSEGFTTGKNCRIEIFGEGKIAIGTNCHIGDNVHMVASSSLTFGNGCLLASKVFISDTSHGSYRADGCQPSTPPNDRPLCGDPVTIGDNVWIGENVVILPGTHIGNGCVIGANAVVTKDLPENCIAVGSPAKPIKRFDEKTVSWTVIDN